MTTRPRPWESASSPFLQEAVSNGNAVEQAIIRRWWREAMGAPGVLVWEYFLEGFYADAVIFLDRSPPGSEAPGRRTAERYPLKDERVILCEAKTTLTAELLGQALVYRSVVLDQGAQLESVHVFASEGSARMIAVAHELGLGPIVGSP